MSTFAFAERGGLGRRAGASLRAELGGERFVVVEIAAKRTSPRVRLLIQLRPMALPTLPEPMTPMRVLVDCRGEGGQRPCDGGSGRELDELSSVFHGVFLPTSEISNLFSSAVTPGVRQAFAQRTIIQPRCAERAGRW